MRRRAAALRFGRRLAVAAARWALAVATQVIARAVLGHLGLY